MADTQTEDAQPVVDALVRTAFATMAVLNRTAAAHDFSLTQLRVLAILRDRQVRMSWLAQYLGLDRSTVSGLVDRAEQRGLVARSADPRDARVVTVTLTAAGRELADLGGREVSKQLAPLIGTLTGAERQRLAVLLERMLEQA